MSRAYRVKTITEEICNALRMMIEAIIIPRPLFPFVIFTFLRGFVRLIILQRIVMPQRTIKAFGSRCYLISKMIREQGVIGMGEKSV